MIRWIAIFLFWALFACFGYEAVFTDDINNSENYLLMSMLCLIYIKMDSGKTIKTVDDNEKQTSINDI